MNGWIKIHRKILSWGWLSDYKVLTLWVHLLLKANWEPKKWKGIQIERGQVVIGLLSLSEETGLSIQSIRTALKKLESTNELTIKSTNKFTVITIVNYNKYQSDDEGSTNKITNTLTNEQQTNNKQITTTKEIKNKRNKEIIYTKKYVKDHKEEIINEAKILYPGKNVSEVMEEFLIKIEIKDYGYKNYKLAYFNWIRNSNKFNLTTPTTNAKQRKYLS